MSIDRSEPTTAAGREPDLVLRHEDQGPWVALSSPGRLSVHVTMVHLRKRLAEMGYIVERAEARQPDSEALRTALQQMVDEFDNKGDEDHGEYPALCTACHALDAAKAALAALPSNVSEPPALLPCGHDPAQQWWGRCRKCDSPSDPPALDVERLAEAYHMAQLCPHGVGAGEPMQKPGYLKPDREHAALIVDEYERLSNGR